MKPGACLLLHGFTGGPHELEPLARHLRSRGWDCIMPTLAGHDRPLRQLHTVCRADWLESASGHAERLTERDGRFDAVGFSMGGLIAAYLANRFPVRRLVLLNAAVYYANPGRFVSHVLRQWRSGCLERVRFKQETTVGAVLEFAKLVRELKPEFARVTVPTLIAQSERDEVVHPRSAAYIANRVRGPKEVTVVPEALHMICMGRQARKLFVEVERFLI